MDIIYHRDRLPVSGLKCSIGRVGQIQPDFNPFRALYLYIWLSLIVPVAYNRIEFVHIFFRRGFEINFSEKTVAMKVLEFLSIMLGSCDRGGEAVAIPGESSVLKYLTSLN